MSETNANGNEPPPASAIISTSHNLTVYANETVLLPCVVRKTDNTIVIWNQCEDPACQQLRSPLTINKENFIEDLRFRVLAAESATAAETASQSSVDELQASFDEVNTVRDDGSKGEFVLLLRRSSGPVLADPAVSAASDSADQTMSLTSWNLEIRKFTKADEACYQCQLNTFQPQTIHYCLKLQSNSYLIFFLTFKLLFLLLGVKLHLLKNCLKKS